MVNEVRFGSVAALQEEILRLQHQIKELQNNREVVWTQGNQSLAKELSYCHQMCCELYYSNASLWKELYSSRKAYGHLQNELKILLERMGGEDENLTALMHITSELLEKSCYSTVVMGLLIC